MAEESLAARITLERERRGWTPAQLAEWMTKAGSPMNQSAIWKIENGQPRRRITLNEAVAFAKVFGVSVEDLAQPSEVVAAGRVADIVERLRLDHESRMELDNRWGILLAELGDKLLEDETGYVVVALNRVIEAATDDHVDVQQSEWSDLSYVARDAAVLTWLDTCVTEEDRLVKLSKRLIERAHRYESAVDARHPEMGEGDGEHPEA